MLVIGNQSAVWGFALAGVHGIVATTAHELNDALDEALNGDYDVVLVTEDAAQLARDRIDHLIARSATPLFVEIPGPEGPRPDRPSLSELIRQTIGVKI